MNPTSETFALGPLTSEDVVAYAPALPFGEIIGSDNIQAYDPSDWPNLTVVGASGLGKTNVINVLAAAAREQGATVYAIGVDDTEHRFDEAAHGLEASEDLIQMIHGEIRSRLAPAHALGAVSVEQLAYEDRPHRIFLIIDDLRSIILRETAPEGTDEAARAAEYQTYLAHSLDKFAKVGQFALVHLIVTVPELTGIPESLRENTAFLDLTSTAPADSGAAHFTVGRGTFSTEPGGSEAVQIFASPAVTRP